MAITKIVGAMKECKSQSGKDGVKSRHLRNAISYIMNPTKTQGGLLIGGGCCNISTSQNVYEDFMNTKKMANKLNGRQGYHFVISFLPEENVSAEISHEIMEKFAKEYLGDNYEYVFATHDDKAHMHSHLVFNSVSRIEPYRKYHYKKGDWEKYIQPITNRLCKEYNLKEIIFDDGMGELQGEEKTVKSNKKYATWEKVIESDLDHFLSEAKSYDNFIKILLENEYEIKENKYLTVKPPGKQRFSRLYQFGEDYKKEIEHIIAQREAGKINIVNTPPPVPKMREYQIFMGKNTLRPKMTKYQRLRLKKLYRTGRMKHHRYRGDWKYRKDILKLNQLKEQYKYLLKYNIKTNKDLEKRVDILKASENSLKFKRMLVYKERKPIKKELALYEEYMQLQEYYLLYKKGYKGYETEAARMEQIIEIFESQNIDIHFLENKSGSFKERLDLIKQEVLPIRKELKLVAKIKEQSQETVERVVNTDGKTRMKKKKKPGEEKEGGKKQTK